MTTIATSLGINDLSFDDVELESEILKVVNSDVTPLGKMLRELLEDQTSSDNPFLSLLPILGANIYASGAGDEKFFINEKKGPEISFRQVVEYQYLKEAFPNTNFGFLFKNKKYSFLEKDYESVHSFFDVLLSFGVCFTVNKIEQVMLPTVTTEKTSLYTVDFESTARMSAFYDLTQYMTGSLVRTLRPGAATLVDIKKFNLDSKEKCLVREDHELRVAISDALAKTIDEAMGEPTSSDNSFSQVPSSL